MSRLLSIPEATQFPMIPLAGFSQANVAASQAQVALKIAVNDATTGSLNITGIPAQYAGSIVGISAVLTNNKTAGAFSVSPTINGTEIASTIPLYRTPMANSVKTAVANADAQQPGLNFNAGDLLGVKLTTDGSFAAGSTPDLYVILYVIYNDVKP